MRYMQLYIFELIKLMILLLFLHLYLHANNVWRFIHYILDYYPIYD